MKLVVVLPVIDPVAAEACVATMAPELADALLVIDQGTQPVVARGPISAATIVRPPRVSCRRYEPARNLGISRCINTALDHLTATGAELLVWVSTSMRFADDGGRRLLDAADRAELGVIGRPACLHAFAVRPAAFTLAGRWDENFYPGYYEDADWRHRLTVATGLPEPLDVVDLPGEARDGNGYDVLRAAMPGRLPINFDALKDYYSAKWGGVPPHSPEVHPLPWGDRPLDWWPPVTREELIERYGLGRR